jgi:ribosomal protein L40E
LLAANETRPPNTRVQESRPLPVQVCFRCGGLLVDIKGSRLAVCRTCGYKDDCC